MDVKLIHPVWSDFLDTVNTVVLTGYWKHDYFLFWYTMFLSKWIRMWILDQHNRK